MAGRLSSFFICSFALLHLVMDDLEQPEHREVQRPGDTGRVWDESSKITFRVPLSAIARGVP
jgi:hypothetical protein